jgi:AbrB family looped-hinge helix DNA binding protein
MPRKSPSEPTKGAVTVVTDRGQISIPADLRRDLELRPGSRLQWEKVTPAELRVVVLTARKPAPGAHAMRGFARRLREQPRRTDDWMRELREGER